MEIPESITYYHQAIKGTSTQVYVFLLVLILCDDNNYYALSTITSVLFCPTIYYVVNDVYTHIIV